MIDPTFGLRNRLAASNSTTITDDVGGAAVSGSGWSISADSGSPTGYIWTASAQNQAVSIPISPTLSFTYSAWVNPSTVGTTGGVLAEAKSSAAAQIADLYLTNTNGKVFGSFAGSSAISRSAAALSVGVWVHLVWTYDDTNNTLRLYVDGSQVDSDSTASLTRDLTATKLVTGHATTSAVTNYPLIGSFSSILRYDYSMSSSDVAALNALGRSGVFGTASDTLLARRHRQSPAVYPDPPGWTTVTVTNTNASAVAGSLARVIENIVDNAGTIVEFASSLSGAIDFDTTTLSIPKRKVIIRGETAGGLITLKSKAAVCRIEASDVQVRNLALMVTPVVAGGVDADGAQIQPRSSSPPGGLTNSGFVNCLMLNSTDEISSAFPNGGESNDLFNKDVYGVYYYRCIFADALGGGKSGGGTSFRADEDNHPKGGLIGDGTPPAIPVRGAFIAESLMLSLQDRNFRFGGGASGFLINNFIVNYQRRTYELGRDSGHIIYASVSAGLLAKKNGEYFVANSGGGDLKAYRDDNGAATLMRDVPDDIWSSRVSSYGNSYWFGQSTVSDLSPFLDGIPGGSQVYHASNWKNGSAWSLTNDDFTQAGFDPSITTWHAPLPNQSMFPYVLTSTYSPSNDRVAIENNILMQAGPRFWEPNFVVDLKIAEALTKQGVVHDFGVVPVYALIAAGALTLSTNTVGRYTPVGDVVAVVENVADPAVVLKLSGAHSSCFEIDATGRTIRLKELVASIGNAVSDVPLSISITSSWYGQTPETVITDFTITIPHEPNPKSWAQVVSSYGPSGTLLQTVTRLWTSDSGVSTSGSNVTGYSDRIAGQVIPAVGAPQLVNDASSYGVPKPMILFPSVTDYLRSSSGPAPANVPSGADSLWLIGLFFNVDTGTGTGGGEAAFFGFGGSGNDNARSIRKITAGAQRPRAGRGLTGGATFTAGSVAGVHAIAIYFDNQSDLVYCYVDGHAVGGDAFAGSGGTPLAMGNIASSVRFTCGVSPSSIALQLVGGGHFAGMICKSNMTSAVLTDLFRTLSAYRIGYI